MLMQGYFGSHQRAARGEQKVNRYYHLCLWSKRGQGCSEEKKGIWKNPETSQWSRNQNWIRDRSQWPWQLQSGKEEEECLFQMHSWGSIPLSNAAWEWSWLRGSDRLWTGQWSWQGTSSSYLRDHNPGRHRLSSWCYLSHEPWEQSWVRGSERLWSKQASWQVTSSFYCSWKEMPISPCRANKIVLPSFCCKLPFLWSKIIPVSKNKVWKYIHFKIWLLNVWTRKVSVGFSMLFLISTQRPRM